MEQLSTQDASFIYMENEFNHMSIAILAVFEGPSPAEGEIEAFLEAKLDLVPRFRQRLRFVPYALGRPVWCDDPHFSLRYHVRHSGMPAPGSAEQVQTMAGRVMSHQLDRSRPLWELWLLDGLQDGNWAALLKMHHCVADGVAAVELLETLLDQKPKQRRRKAVKWEPEEQPTPSQLATMAISNQVKIPKRGLGAIRTAVKELRETGSKAKEIVEGMVAYRRPTAMPLEVSLNGPIGPHRSWRWASTSLADINRIRGVHGGTVNDVVLAAISHGFRALLISRKEAVDDYAVRSLVPVSVRHEDEHNMLNNRVSAMFVELHVGMDSQLECLTAISEQMSHNKRHHQAVAGEALSSLSALAPPALLAMGTRLALGIENHSVQTVTTNVPGPKHPLYAAGRKMLTGYLYVPLVGSTQIGVAIFSYQGQLTLAVTSDYDNAPDTQVLCDGIEAGFAQLLALS
jgi:WS/DGAT/MGAT family acyltransferase